MLLAADFLQQAAKRLNCPIPRLTAENITQLCSYGWPGNIRELHNVLERALILSGGRTLHFDLDDPAPLKSKQAEPVASIGTRAQLLELERSQIVTALQKTKGKIYGSDGAAELLGMRPTTLSSKIAALKITRSIT